MLQLIGFGVQGLGIGIWGLGFRDLGFRRIRDLGFQRFRVWGLCNFLTLVRQPSQSDLLGRGMRRLREAELGEIYCALEISAMAMLNAESQDTQQCQTSWQISFRWESVKSAHTHTQAVLRPLPACPVPRRTN